MTTTQGLLAERVVKVSRYFYDGRMADTGPQPLPNVAHLCIARRSGDQAEKIAKSGSKALRETMAAGRGISMIGQYDVGFESGYLGSTKCGIRQEF